MKWEDFNAITEEAKLEMKGQYKTDIECPKCGAPIYYDSTMVLTSYPEKFKYWCKCGWSATSYKSWARDFGGGSR